MKRLRIGIDARLAGKHHAGIGRYIEELVRGVLSLETPYAWTVFVSADTQLPWLGSSANVDVIRVPVRHYTVREQLVFPLAAARARLDLLHVPHFNVPVLYGGKVIVTIHDLLWHEKKERNATTLPPLLHAVKYGAYRFVSEYGMRKAERIIVPSKAVADEVARYAGREKVSIIPEGVHDAFFSPKQGEKRRYAFPYIIYTGSLYPHKNVPIVLDAMKAFPTLHFLVAGSRTVFRDAFERQVKEAGLESRVHMLGYVEDEELALLYSQAVALVQPSFSEGFGLTGVEAMAAGAPVIASDIPVLREVYGDGAAYFSPANSNALKQRLKDSLGTQKFRQQRIEEGRRVAQRYRWPTVAKKTIEVYASVL